MTVYRVNNASSLEHDRELHKSYLERRIAEEAGPVRTYPLVQWIRSERRARRARSDVPIVTIEPKYGVRLNKRATRLLGDPPALRFGWHSLEDALVIAAANRDDPDAHPYPPASAYVGGRALVRRIMERLPAGQYVAEFVNGQLLVRTPKGGTQHATQARL